MARAVLCYAAFHELDPATVDHSVVEKSAEGADFWANHGLDNSARGPVGQQINRALQKHPQVKNVYKWLTDDLKKKFRMSWAVARDFDQVSKKRVRSIKQINKQTELGQWRSELQLQVHFGGVDHPEAVRQTNCYISMCKKYKDLPGLCRFVLGVYVQGHRSFLATQRSSQGGKSNR